MEDYNKIIESLNIRLSKCRNIKIIKPFRMENVRDIENTLILVNKGAIRLDLVDDIVQAGEMIFIPAKSNVTMTYGVLAKAATISYESFLNNEDGFYEVNSDQNLKDIENENFK